MELKNSECERKIKYKNIILKYLIKMELKEWWMRKKD